MKSILKKLEGKWEWLKMQNGFHRSPVRAGIRLVTWRAICLLQTGATIRLRRWNLRMFLPTRWRVMGEYIFTLREYYEPELAYLEEVLSPGKVFFDVGANIGIYTLVASRIVGEAGRVVAFEPSIQSFPGLQRNVNLNGLTNVTAFRTALSEKSGKACLYQAPDPVANSVCGDPGWRAGTEQITLETLDRVTEQTSIQHVDVIKIDAEGAEELVLRGAKKVLTAMRPVVIFEVNPEACARFGLSPYGARELLENLGYEFRILHNSGTFFRPRPAPPYCNVVAIPRILGANAA
jgi:FkbM family methyltransferase